MLTKEQVAEYLKTDEGKEEFKSIAKEFGFEDEDSVKGLKDKNRELLGKMKVIKSEKEKYESLLGDVDEDTILKALDLAKKGEDNADDKTKREIEQYKLQAEKYNNELQALKVKANNRAIEAELSRSFVANNIDPLHHDILTSAIKSKLKVEEVDGKESIIYDDGLYGKPFDEYMGEFVKGSGQAYIKKPANAGSNSHSMSGGASSVYTREDLKDSTKSREYYKALKEGKSVSISKE